MSIPTNAQPSAGANDLKLEQETAKNAILWYDVFSKRAMPGRCCFHAVGDYLEDPNRSAEGVVARPKTEA